MKPLNPPSAVPTLRYKVPPQSGNKVNGLGETEFRRPSLVFHWSPGRQPHPWFAMDLHFTMISGINSPAMGWGSMLQRLRNMWQLRNANGPVAGTKAPVDDPARMATEIKAKAREIARRHGAEVIVGIAEIGAASMLDVGSVPCKYAICIGMPMNRDIMEHAPQPDAGTEVMRAYRKVARIAIELSKAIRKMGYPAKAFGETKTTDLIQIPAAINAGLGQLGKHGSMISKEFGSNFRLSTVATDLPLALDAPVDIGVDDLCATCRRCTIDCPPGAILDEKQMVRGVEKWYVDFDKCAPYFSENGGCAICIEVCPWSEPGRGPKLSEQLLAKRAKAASRKERVSEPAG